jgi:GST-like protein
LASFPNVKRWFTAIDGTPRSRGRAVGKGHEFEKVNGEETKRAHFPPNYPASG